MPLSWHCSPDQLEHTPLTNQGSQTFTAFTLSLLRCQAAFNNTKMEETVTEPVKVTEEATRVAEQFAPIDEDDSELPVEVEVESER